MKNFIITFIILQFILLFFSFSFALEKGFITGDGVRLRDKPNGVIITKLPKNTYVIILDQTDEIENINGKTAVWYNVRTNNYYEGWVFGAYLKKHILKIDNENFKLFKKLFKDIKLIKDSLPDFPIFHMTRYDPPKTGLLEGIALDILKSYDDNWTRNDDLFYALGKFNLNGYEAYIVWGPDAWDVKMYVLDEKNHVVVTNEVVAYGPQDRGYQIYIDTKFIDLNNDGCLDLLIHETTESFEHDITDEEAGCWEKSMTVKLWEKDRFIESKMFDLQSFKDKYFPKKCKSDSSANVK